MYIVYIYYAVFQAKCVMRVTDAVTSSYCVDYYRISLYIYRIYQVYSLELTKYYYYYYCSWCSIRYSCLKAVS